MQLKFKKFILLSTIIVYCASFLLQSNLAFFQTWAAENDTSRVNIVAILVDDKIYDSISSWLKWYATNYVQQQLSDTLALVMPLDLTNVSAYDIHRMMENIYFDWLENVNSSLIGLIMVWDIPLPVVNQDGYVFPTVYPYVDFENQKYVWDSDSQYFVPNNNPAGQAEIWHWLINYWINAQLYLDFFDKIKKYMDDPESFIWDGIWYEDFIASKEWFLNENFPYYRNKIMFGEDLSYQRYSTLMKKMFYVESTDNSVDIVEDLWNAVESVWWDSSEIFESIDGEIIQKLKEQWSEGMHTTKMIQQEIEDSLLADYDDLFSKTALSIMRENVLAWWRWLRTYEDADGQTTLLANVDNSSSLIQLKDTMYLWNENLQWLLENLNELMEKMIDEKIEEEKYSMDIVIPLEYKRVEWKRIYFSCYPFVDRFENYYFWRNARLINSAQELSIYRWTYRNLLNLDEITYDSLLTWDNPVVSNLDKTDVRLKSIWGSYDIFSNQVEWNRWYDMFRASNDVNIYEENKSRKEEKPKWVPIRWLAKIARRSWPEWCTWSKSEERKCEGLTWFALRWWWWASAINLNEDKVPEWRYELKWYDARNSWKTIYDMWWFQSLLSGEDEWMNGTWWTDWLWKWPQTAATSFKSYIKYSSLTEVEWWERKSVLFYKYYRIYTNHSPDTHTWFKNMNYWDLSSTILKSWEWSKEWEKTFKTEKSGPASDNRCALTEEYTYKTLSSIVKHDSTNVWEINWIDYDKYWDEWELWKNYYDIRVAYEDLNVDLNRIIGELSWLSADIESNTKTISGYIGQLSWLVKTLEESNNKRDALDSQISSLADEITSLESSLTSVEEQIKDIKLDIERYEALDWQTSVDEEWNEIILSYAAEIERLNWELNSLQNSATKLKWTISNKREDKANKELERAGLQSWINWLNGNVWNILSTVSGIVDSENVQLGDTYSEIVWLFADNIIWTMEYIIYLEWWNPEDYSWYTVADGLPKVPFLPEWIRNITNISKLIQSNVNSLKVQYKKIYLLVVDQQNLWKILEEKLRSECVRWSWEGATSAQIDVVDKKMNDIFTVKSRDQNETDPESMEECINNDCNTEHLTKDTADEKVETFVKNLKLADLMFKNITKEDTGGVAIIEAALADIDFQAWAAKKWISLGGMSGAALINQYARWAQTDWENSTWAKVNRELLAWATIHMSGMNLLTPDRPIDSPRYVSMQSIAWNEIKLIYPDLFKVEVFVLTWQDKSWYDIHELLTWWQIKENLVKYLSWKVEEYNKILETEYKMAEMSMGSKSSYYKKLQDLGLNMATPEKSIRPYTYFTYEDFENALWWSWMLDTISEMLYYQSLTNKKKLSTWSIADDIELIKKSFSLNDKRERILKDYLTEWTGEDFKTNKNPLLVIPTYELSWYEVAYVNSDGKDYIIPVEEEIDTTNNKIYSAKIRRHQETQPERDFDKECNIPSSWKLPLFKLEWWKPSSPWAEWFKCWLAHLKDSVKVKVTFDNSLWEVIIWSWFGAFLESLWMAYVSDTREELTAWWDQMSKHADDWNTFLTEARDGLFPSKKKYDADKDITQLQVEAEKHNREVNKSNASILSKNIKISNSNVLLSDNNPTSVLRIESISDINSVRVVFTLTWDWWSLKIGDEVLHNDGKDQIIKSFNPKKDPLNLLISSAGHIAWKVGLDIKIYLGWWYIEKVLKYTVSPGQLDHFMIEVYDKKTVAWMISPMEIIWYDKYENRVDWWLETFDVTVSQWEFLKDWAYQTKFSTNDFRDLRLYYHAPLELSWPKAFIQISKHNGSWDVVAKYEQPLVDASLVVKLNSDEILWWKNLVAHTERRLTNDESIYVWWRLNLSKLQKLDVEIQDLGGKPVDVNSQILITSQNWLVYIWEVKKDDDWKNMFFETSKSYISGGKVTMYYYPTTVAWDDVIKIDIPWLETRKINLSIKPAGLDSSQLVLQKDVLDLWDSMYVELFLSDKWWNLIDSSDSYTLLYDEDKIEFIEPCWHDWEVIVPYVNWYGKYEIFGTWAWIAYIKFWNDFIYFNVDKHIFPNSGLNIMYLNYFGDDRWNQWWYLSDNNKYIESVMSKSNKIITTTTQLVSEDKIKKMVWKIEPWFKVWDPDSMGTLLSIRWNAISMIVWWISSMNAIIPSLSWTEKISNSKNYALFIPNDPKYSVDKNWVLYNSGESVVSLVNWDVTLQLSTSFMDNGDNVWKLIYNWVNYGNVVIHCSDFSPNVDRFDTPWERYLVNPTFTNWSTYVLSSVGIFDLLSNFELNTNYKSIQNSDELEEKIWFLWDFKNITLFGEWEIVGEATRKFWSEFVINLWDPVLSRKSLNENVYGTDYDGWVGQEIYVDSENNIFGTYQIDFDSNGTKDLLVVYLNWSIKLAKNYGWTPDLRNMQELMRIAVPIKEVFVWDADWKWGEDIIILTQNNQLRAYLNNWGEFDVDGKVACLNQNVFEWEISSTPSSLDWIFQIFMEYMEGDTDENIDIITYDNKWYIKVFYWWSTKNGPNYLSTEKYACDSWWYDREKSNMTVVDALWVSIDESQVFDNSMLHRRWMTKPTIEIKEDELEEYGINIDEDSLKDLIKTRDKDSDAFLGDAIHEIMDKDKFDVQKASDKFIDESAKFVDVTLYENTLEWENWNNYVFAPSSYLDPECGEDIGSVRKNYYKKGWGILQDGDIVTVKVTVRAWEWGSFQWAFWDIIQWPRNLYYDENKILKSIRFLSNKGDAVIKQRDWKFAYIIDNISLWAWQEMVFEYDLEYKSTPLRKMEITYDTFYWWGDHLPDIKLQSIDWCEKDFDVYKNLWRSFSWDKVELQKLINDTYESEDAKTEDYTQGAIDAWSDINQIPWIVGDKIDRISLLNWNDIEIDDIGDVKDALLKKIEEDWLQSLNMNLNVELSIFEEQTDAIADIIDDITKWMCDWFQFWWTSNCKWLPVPFNQAFLAPGKYHLFGCWELPLWKLEKWLPLFFFPSSMPGYQLVPIPDWVKRLDDEFIRFLGSNWNYPSFVRIYVAPTLTAQVWIGICFGKYSLSNALKSPWSDVAGNCIVFAIKPQCSNDSAPTNLESPYESYSDFVEEVRDSGVCLESQKWPQNTKNWFNSSAFDLRSYRGSIRTVSTSREDIIVNRDDVDDILSDIQRLLWDKVNAREMWDNAMKWRFWSISLSMFDKVFWEDKVDQVYDKYFWNAKLTVADNYYVDYSTNVDFWIINLEREAYIASDDWSEVRNSIIIWSTDILWWDYRVNKVKWWIPQWIQDILIRKWLDPQIRYIASQLSMHVNVILPDLSSLMGDDLSVLKSISEKSPDINIREKTYNATFDYERLWSDYKGFFNKEKEAMNKIWDGLWWVFDGYSDKVKTSQRYWLSTKSVDEFNNKIWNPFEALASLMNESNIINVSIEPLTVRVPMIFSEDINEYWFYLQQYYEENKRIFNDWRDVLNAALSSCSKKPIEEQESCRAEATENLNAFIEFEKSDWPKIENSIYTNLMILQEYRDFPFEIYEWIHVIDRYMSEIASLVNNTVGYLSYWVVTNSERFVWYIDAITLMLNIIKTYQLIIDFSVDWSKKCGNCAKDTYDQYSCKLSLLCNSIELPIIQIPNFKLPNITLDFSNIDVWLDIILPQFNFQPIKVPLPDLPNLPEPPSIWANIKLFDLPNIPILPEPPELPEVPSFIPEVELELPILPPAPELPELPNRIEWIIKFAKMVWKIYCIVKKQFWFVWESSLKAKIEQITQRTYEVEWIDNIMDFTNWSPAPLKNYGVDYEISSYVDLQFTMSDFYDYMDVLTKWINNIGGLVEYIWDMWSDWVGDHIIDYGVKARDYVDWINLNLQLWMSTLDESDWQWLTSDEIKYVDYDSAKKRLDEVLAYFKSELNNTTFADSIGWDVVKIENDINKPNVVSGNTEWINNMKNEIMDYLDWEKVYYDDLAKLINEDYDGFLAMVNSQNNNVNDWSGEKLLTFNVQLFNLDPSTKETVKSISKTNPYRSLLENKQEIIDWYWNAINSNTSESLWLTEKEYLVLRNNISSMRNQISTLYSIITPVSSTQLVAKNWNSSSNKSLVAAWEWARIWSNMEVAKVVDPSMFSDWIYEKMIEWEEVWKLTKVVNSDSFVEEIWGNFYDTNHFGTHDIILRDENSIYKKCASQSCNTVRPISLSYYVKHVNSVPYKETRLEFDKRTKLKIADWDVEVKNWEVIWQSYDILSFSWDLSDVDAYLIKLVERIDYSYEKNDAKAPISYILALPNGVELSDLYENKIKLELLNDTKKTIKTIESLYWNPLVQVVYYDSQKDKANIVISNVERKWYYGRISTLNLDGDTYYINSPWSNQIVAWKQAVWDDKPPLADQKLYRPSVDQIVSEWDDLEWYVGTNYILKIKWKDNVALSYINVSQGGEILEEKHTSEKEDELEVQLDMHFYNEMETFDLLWIDQFWNKTEKTITVAYYIPTIKVTNVARNPDWETVDITAVLSQDMDQWTVSFQRRRWSLWKTMKKKFSDCADLAIWPNNWVIVGTGYSAGNQIAMYGKNDSVIALLNPDTSEIKIQSGYENQYDVKVKVENSAVLYVYDKETKTNKFSVSIPTDSCVKIESKVDGYYGVDSLPEKWNMWMFNGWTVVHKDGNNILIASPTCHLYSEYGLEWTYDYDKDRDAVLLTLYEPHDLQHSYPIYVWLKTKPFLVK